MKKSFVFTIIFLLLATIVTAKTLILADSKSNLYFAVGKHYFSQDDFQNAISYFEKSVELDSQFEEAYHNLAVSYYKTGNSGKAVENFQNAIWANPSYSKAYYSLGLLYFENNDFENAVLNFEKAVSLDGTVNQHFDLAAAYVARFREKEDSGEITTADLEDLRKAAIHFEQASSVPNAESNLEIVNQVLDDYTAIE